MLFDQYVTYILALDRQRQPVRAAEEWRLVRAARASRTKRGPSTEGSVERTLRSLPEG